jgi:hypothetical protein
VRNIGKFKSFLFLHTAIIFDNIVELYYINSKELTKEQHANHPEVKKHKLQQILNKIVKETK